MKQHAVPENIMDVEFKLFGSLTAKQFGYIVAGGIMGLFFYFVFKSFNSMLLAWVFAFLSIVLGLSLALIRINEQPFEIWLVNFLEAMFSSQKRVWRKGKKTPSTFTRGKIQQVPPTPKPITPQLQQLKGIKSVGTVDTQKQKVDKQPSIPSHPFKALDQTQQDVKPIKSDVPMETSTIAGRGVQGETHYIPGSAQGAIKVSTNQKLNRPVSIPGKYKGSQTVVSEPVKGVKAPQVSSGAISAKTPTIQVQSHVSPTPLQDTQPYVNKGVIYSDILPKKEQVLQVEDKGVTSLQPSAQLSDKGQDLVDEDRSLRQKIVEISEEKKQLEQQLAKTQGMYSDIKRQNERIVQQLEGLKTKPAGTIVEKQAIPVQKVATEATPPTPPVKPKLPRILPKVLRKGDSEEEIFLRPKIYDGPFLTKKPNVISGIIKTSEGNLLPGVVIIVKNEKNRPVRAMKTNSLGQFITTTALENGVYSIELSKSKYSFGKYEIKLTGEILPTYEFIADK